MWRLWKRTKKEVNWVDPNGYNYILDLNDEHLVASLLRSLKERLQGVQSAWHRRAYR